MKTKFIGLAALFVLSNFTYAQTLRVGVNLANVTITNDGDIEKNFAKWG